MQQYKWKTFILSYIKSMRLYYAFVTGIAGWIGVSFYHFCMPDFIDYWKRGDRGDLQALY